MESVDMQAMLWVSEAWNIRDIHYGWFRRMVMIR
jgi:hypothetical protein